MAVKALSELRRSLPGKQITVRNASRDDLFAMTSLLSELFTLETDFSPDLRRQREGLAALMASADAVLLVAAMQGEIVGMCTLQPLISTAEGGVVGLVEDLIVAEAFRNMGVGSKLLAAIEKKARQRGMSRLQLLTDQDNRQADAFYGRVGWKVTHLNVRRKILT